MRAVSTSFPGEPSSFNTSTEAVSSWGGKRFVANCGVWGKVAPGICFECTFNFKWDIGVKPSWETHTFTSCLCWLSWVSFCRQSRLIANAFWRIHRLSFFMSEIRVLANPSCVARCQTLGKTIKGSTHRSSCFSSQWRQTSLCGPRKDRFIRKCQWRRDGCVRQLNDLHFRRLRTQGTKKMKGKAKCSNKFLKKSLHSTL